MQQRINYNQPVLITYKHKKSTSFFKFFLIIVFVGLAVLATVNANALIEGGRNLLAGDSSVFASIFGSKNNLETVTGLEFGFVPNAVSISEDGNIKLTCVKESVVKVNFDCFVKKIGNNNGSKYVQLESGDTTIIYSGLKVLGVLSNRTIKSGYVLGLTNENSEITIEVFYKNSKIISFTQVGNGVSWKID